MANTRNAGRKPRIAQAELNKIRDRINSGERVSSIASEYGVSRQALYKRLREEKASHEICVDYYVGDELCSSIYVDTGSEALRLVNYTDALSKRAFGYNDAPDMSELRDLIERQYLISKGVTGPDCMLMTDGCDPIDILKDLYDNGQMGGLSIREGSHIPSFEFSGRDIVIRRTDTDGYQLKAITRDRRHFVKSQAIMGDVALRDWAVEIIASDICDQLSIPCVRQRQCRFVYEGRIYDGVYSDNFELDGYSFISFESLLNRNYRSTDDDRFIKKNAIDKLKWCAYELASISGLPIELTQKYMIDLAVLDCLIGNTDRHTRNFGLFYNSNTSAYEIPLIFDNGMGLFENDNYRDRYESFEAAMNNVYVAPYGEDPFDMMRMLDAEFDIRKMYPGIEGISYSSILSTPFALEYERRMMAVWQK